MWEPGDRIFLFGFSRGAYTVRCLAAVLGQCGVPTTMADGSPLRPDVGATTRLAREAVKKVYQHVSSPKDTMYLPQREALATRFRQRYGCDAGGVANAVPFFIGMFDTVASLGSYALSAALIGGSAGRAPPERTRFKVPKQDPYLRAYVQATTEFDRMVRVTDQKLLEFVRRQMQGSCRR